MLSKKFCRLSLSDKKDGDGAVNLLSAYFHLFINFLVMSAKLVNKLFSSYKGFGLCFRKEA